MGWQLKTVAKNVRRFCLIGVLKIVGATSQYSNKPGEVLRCIKFVRDPADDEWAMFWKHGSAGNVRPDDAWDEEEIDINIDDEMGGETRRDLLALTESENPNSQHGLKEVDVALPSWVPNKPLSNVLYEYLLSRGTNGASTMVGYVTPSLGL